MINYNPPVIQVIKLEHADDIELPSYETAGAAGMDLRAAVPEGKPLELAVNSRVLVPTGLILEIPHGFEAQVRPRSGLALKYGLTCLNTPGTIDSDYRGEIKVLLINLGEKSFFIERHMRIAQLVIAPVIQAYLEKKENDLLAPTVRGAAGFGSTGIV